MCLPTASVSVSETPELLSSVEEGERGGGAGAGGGGGEVAAGGGTGD